MSTIESIASLIEIEQIIIDLCDLFLDGKETPEELAKIKERLDALDNE